MTKTVEEQKSHIIELIDIYGTAKTGGSKRRIIALIDQLLIEAKQEAVKPYYHLEFAVEEAIKNGVFMPSVEEAYDDLQSTLKEKGK